MNLRDGLDEMHKGNVASAYVCKGGCQLRIRRRNVEDIPAKRTFTATPAFKKSAILVNGTKYPK